MIQIDIDAIPVPWSASQVCRKRHFNPKHKEKIWTQWEVKSQYSEEPISGYVVLYMKFTEPFPASASKKKKEKMLSGEIRPIRADNTNFQKFYEDCLKNIVFLDDRYVVKNVSEKVYGLAGRIEIKVYTLEEYNSADQYRKS